MTTPLRPLGRSGLETSPIIFGGNVFGWTADEPTSFALLDAYVAGGGNHIDTADVYSTWVAGHTGGESETIVGRWLARSGHRDRVVIATKVGKPMASGARGLSREHILASAEGSLRRLGVETIDLYYAHEDDASVPLDESLEAFARLIRAGKVRAIGASNYTAPRLAQALATGAEAGLPGYTVLQTHYNLVQRGLFEGDLEAVCRRDGVAVVAYYALASGFLTGKYRSAADLGRSVRGKGVEKYLTPKGLAVLAALDAVAEAHGATQAAVAVAWLLSRRTVAGAIASATSVAQLEQLLAASRLTLGADDLARLDAASGPTAV